MTLKYACMLDILIHHIVHMAYFDYTLPILQNFEKTICDKKLDWTSFKISALKLFLELEYEICHTAPRDFHVFEYSGL